MTLFAHFPLVWFTTSLTLNFPIPKFPFFTQSLNSIFKVQLKCCLLNLKVILISSAKYELSFLPISRNTCYTPLLSTQFFLCYCVCVRACTRVHSIPLLHCSSLPERTCFFLIFVSFVVLHSLSDQWKKKSILFDTHKKLFRG